MQRAVFLLAIFACTLCLHNAAEAQNVAQGVKVIVIDAGHGGARFPGARYFGTSEKDINLQVALRLGALIEKNLPQIKVVYTRTKEKQFSDVLTRDLQARADIANNAQGDLFISIHSNASRDSSVRGVETLIMGESAMETSVNEAVLFANNKDEFLDMSDSKTAAIVRAYIQNLQFTYGEYSEMMARLVQKSYAKSGRVTRGVRRQPLKVLYATDMPSILTEIGFMSNAQEFKYITSDKGQQEIAQDIYEAVNQYVAYVHRTLLPDAPADKPAVKEPVTEPVKQPQANPEIPNVKDADVIATAAAPKEQPQPIAERPKEQPQVIETPNEQPKQNSEQQPVAASKPASKYGYAIQIMAHKSHLTIDSRTFGSHRAEVREYRAATGAYTYKYCVGFYSTRAESQRALSGVRKSYPQAFVVAVDDATGKIRQ